MSQRICQDGSRKRRRWYGCASAGAGVGGGKAKPVIGAKGKGEGKGVIHYFDGGFWSGSWVGFADDKGKGKATNVLLTREHE